MVSDLPGMRSSVELSVVAPVYKCGDCVPELHRQLIAALEPVIAGVASLNDFHPASLAKLGARGHFNSSTQRIQPDFTLFSGSTPLLFVDPADAATIYDTPNATLNTSYKGSTLDGTGVNIGIAGDSKQAEALSGSPQRSATKASRRL